MSLDFKIPGAGTSVATPVDANMLAFFGSRGAKSFMGVTFTQDQLRYLRRFYGFDPKVTAQMVEDTRVQHEEAQRAAEEKYQKEVFKIGPKPVATPFDAKGTRDFLEAGEDINLFRHLTRDGQRVMAFLSKYLERGEDPVKLTIKMAAAYGLEVCAELQEWAEAENCPEE